MREFTHDSCFYAPCMIPCRRKKNIESILAYFNIAKKSLIIKKNLWIKAA